MKIAIIGNGAIAQFVQAELLKRGHETCAILRRPGSARSEQHAFAQPPMLISAVDELPKQTDHVIDCAGHSGLKEHGENVLRAGYDLTTLSIGALADQNFSLALERAARAGGSRLLLASGAIGALDCLRAAKVGRLSSVRYVGRKPPLGWKGSPAEQKLDLASVRAEPETHFLGSAREAATSYPKNANVAAAVALAGLGFDDTKVELVADPTVSHNIHEIVAHGDFGELLFRISGEALPDNPRSSALAAMSVISVVEQLESQIIGC